MTCCWPIYFYNCIQVAVMACHDPANGGGRVWFVILLLGQGIFFIVTGYSDFKGDQQQSHHVKPNDCHKIERYLSPLGYLGRIRKSHLKHFCFQGVPRLLGRRLCPRPFVILVFFCLGWHSPPPHQAPVFASYSYGHVIHIGPCSDERL